jgi:hypothetical protein
MSYLATLTNSCITYHMGWSTCATNGILTDTYQELYHVSHGLVHMRNKWNTYRHLPTAVSRITCVGPHARQMEYLATLTKSCITYHMGWSTCATNGILSYTYKQLYHVSHVLVYMRDKWNT